MKGTCKFYLEKMILPEEHVALTCKKHGLIADLTYQNL
jgi:hypothetical protein